MFEVWVFDKVLEISNVTFRDSLISTRVVKQSRDRDVPVVLVRHLVLGEYSVSDQLVEDTASTYDHRLFSHDLKTLEGFLKSRSRE